MEYRVALALKLYEGADREAAIQSLADLVGIQPVETMRVLPAVIDGDEAKLYLEANHSNSTYALWDLTRSAADVYDYGNTQLRGFRWNIVGVLVVSEEHSGWDDLLADIQMLVAG